MFGKTGIIDSPFAVGGWSEYKTAASPLDTDEDGMPDEWEKKNGLNPKMQTTGIKSIKMDILCWKLFK